MGIFRQSSTRFDPSKSMMTGPNRYQLVLVGRHQAFPQRHSSTSERNQNTTIPKPQARVRQRSGWGRQAPQTATKTAARETPAPNCRATSNEPAYKDGTNANKTDAVARTNPARDKVEERVRGCLARAHRIQLKMITASQGPHATRVTPIALAGVSTGLTLIPE